MEPIKAAVKALQKSNLDLDVWSEDILEEVVQIVLDAAIKEIVTKAILNVR